MVGSYEEHNAFFDYDIYLFKDINTSKMVALEYGAGPGRNLIRFNERFRRIDAVDISKMNREKCKENLKFHGITFPNYFITTGDNIPAGEIKYDLVFSVICLQHICVHQIRYSIMNDIYRVLKNGGLFCAQMGFGGKAKTHNYAEYYENKVDAKGTNGALDVSITNEQNLIDDLKKIGFTNYSSDIASVGPGDNHKKWIWFRAQK